FGNGFFPYHLLVFLNTGKLIGIYLFRRLSTCVSFFFILIRRFLINLGISIKKGLGAGGPENRLPTADFHAGFTVESVAHLAGQEVFPDQLVKLELLRRQEGF